MMFYFCAIEWRTEYQDPEGSYPDISDRDVA
jgi:hypothetical protein